MRTSIVGSASRPLPGGTFPKVLMLKLFVASSCECTRQGRSHLGISHHSGGGGTCRLADPGKLAGGSEVRAPTMGVSAGSHAFQVHRRVWM